MNIIKKPIRVDDEPQSWPGQHLVVLALDPGVTTGWSAIRYPLVSLVERGVSKTLIGCEWMHGEIRRPFSSDRFIEASDSQHVDDILELGREVWAEMVREDDALVFVAERFDLRMMSMDSALLAPVRVLSIWKDRLRDSDIPRFYQTPADAKSVVNDTRLRTWGMWVDGVGPHTRDADRHNVLFIRKFMAKADIRSRVGLSLPRPSQAAG